jgi:hypothetical protein
MNSRDVSSANLEWKGKNKLASRKASLVGMLAIQKWGAFFNAVDRDSLPAHTRFFFDRDTSRILTFEMLIYKHSQSRSF